MLRSSSMVEHPAVNRRVGGSSPSCGANPHRSFPHSTGPRGRNRLHIDGVLSTALGLPCLAVPRGWCSLSPRGAIFFCPAGYGRVARAARRAAESRPQELRAAASGGEQGPNAASPEGLSKRPPQSGAVHVPPPDPVFVGAGFSLRSFLAPIARHLPTPRAEARAYKDAAPTTEVSIFIPGGGGEPPSATHAGVRSLRFATRPPRHSKRGAALPSAATVPSASTRNAPPAGIP